MLQHRREGNQVTDVVKGKTEIVSHLKPETSLDDTLIRYKSCPSHTWRNQYIVSAAEFAQERAFNIFFEMYFEGYDLKPGTKQTNVPRGLLSAIG